MDDTLRSHIFQKDIIKCSNAQLYVSDAAVLADDYVGSNTIYCDIDKSATFSVNDTIACKDIKIDTGISITKVVMTVSNVGSPSGNPPKQPYTVTLVSGSLGDLQKGMTVVRTSGATLLFDSSNMTSYTPFMDVRSGDATQMRVGKLDGLGGGYTGYGIIILNNGLIACGQTGHAVGTGFWLDYNSGNPRFSVGNSFSYINFNSSGVLTIKAASGSSIIDITGGTITAANIQTSNTVGQGTSGEGVKLNSSGIYGYNTSGVVQWECIATGDNKGAIVAGAGNVILNSSGLTLSGQALRFVASDVLQALIFSGDSDSKTLAISAKYLYLNAKDVNSPYASGILDLICGTLEINDQVGVTGRVVYNNGLGSYYLQFQNGILIGQGSN